MTKFKFRVGRYEYYAIYISLKRAYMGLHIKNNVEGNALQMLLKGVLLRMHKHLAMEISRTKFMFSLSPAEAWAFSKVMQEVVNKLPVYEATVVDSILSQIHQKTI